MTPHVARGYYGGAVVFFGRGAEAGSEEQGIVDRSRRYRRGCRRPSSGGNRRSVFTDQVASPNLNPLVGDTRGFPFWSARKKKGETIGGRKQEKGGGARIDARKLQMWRS